MTYTFAVSIERKARRDITRWSCQFKFKHAFKFQIVFIKDKESLFWALDSSMVSVKKSRSSSKQTKHK